MGKIDRNVTALDVAKAAGVSKWTAIRAFKPGSKIAPDTKAKVLKAASALGYEFNMLAQSLATSKTHQVAILVNDFGNPYKLPTLDLLTAALQSKGILGILININEEFDYVQAISNAKQRQLDAVVLFGGAQQLEVIQNSIDQSSALPFFVLGRESMLKAIPSVGCDAGQAIDEIGAHLLERNYKKPCYMSGASDLSATVGRRRNFRSFWKQYRDIEVVEISADRYDRDSGARAMRAYLSSTPIGQRCDVIMCENDVLAIGALDVIRFEFGLSVPQDMAVVGFDGIDLAFAPSFALTTYRQPVTEMVDALMGMLTGESDLTHVHCKGKLHLGRTT